MSAFSVQNENENEGRVWEVQSLLFPLLTFSGLGETYLYKSIHLFLLGPGCLYKFSWIFVIQNITWRATLRGTVPHQWNLIPASTSTTFRSPLPLWDPLPFDLCHSNHPAELSTAKSKNSTLCLGVRPLKRSPLPSNRIPGHPNK